MSGVQYVPNLYGVESCGPGVSRIIPVLIPESDVKNLKVEKYGLVKNPIMLPTDDGGVVTIRMMIHLRNEKTNELIVLFGTRGAIRLMSRLGGISNIIRKIWGSLKG